MRGAVNAVAGQVTGNGGSGNSGTSAAAANPNSDNTASIADRGTSAIMTTASATVSSTGVDGGIAATYAVASQWDGGYVANYTITQFGRDFDDRWRLQFTLPENASISNACCAQLAQSGTQYTLDAREL